MSKYRRISMPKCPYCGIIHCNVTPTRKKGHWIMNSDFPDKIICSCCNTNYDMWFWEQGTMNYCPHCGARMESK